MAQPTQTAPKTNGGSTVAQPAQSKGAVATIKDARLPYHPAIQERYGIDEASWRALTDAVFPAAKTTAAVDLALSYCKARKLDPFKRVVHIVPIYDRETRKWIETVWPGIAEHRTTAFRTNQYAGADAAQYGETKTKVFNGTDKDDRPINVSLSFPEWCQLTVYRLIGGQRVPIPGPRVYWLETYSKASHFSEVPNDRWKRAPFQMIEKCFDAETEILTDRGFQRFSEVTGRVLQVTDGGLASTDAKPFSRRYSGAMVALRSRDLDFVVTPNHDMVTTAGRMEAGTLYEMARSRPQFFIPRCVSGSAPGFAISDADLKLAAAFLADGFDGHGDKLAFKVSRPAKRRLLMALDPISVTALDNAGAEAIAIGGRTVVTRQAQTLYQFDARRVRPVCSVKKAINVAALLQLSRRQAALFVDTWLECDGSRNKKTGVRRLYTSLPDHAAAFEVAAVSAGLAVSDRKARTSDIGTKPNLVITVSERSEIGVIRWGRGDSKANTGARTGLEIEQNGSDEVWCVEVPSHTIIVRRRGFSMVCGNCAEAAALRRAFPEELGGEPTAEEVGSIDHEVSAGPVDVTPATAAPPRPMRKEFTGAGHEDLNNRFRQTMGGTVIDAETGEVHESADTEAAGATNASSAEPVQSEDDDRSAPTSGAPAAEATDYEAQMAACTTTKELKDLHFSAEFKPWRDGDPNAAQAAYNSHWDRIKAATK